MIKDTPLQPKHHRMDSNSSNSTTNTTTNTTTSSVLIYSLLDQSVVEINDFKDEEDDTTVVTCIKSNHKVIVLVI